MEGSYIVKNFRVFNSKGAHFRFKPITILTGANCAGKSSLVKSLLLLKGYFEQGEEKDFYLEKTPLPFSNENVYINGIDNALNYDSKDDKCLVFSIFQNSLTDNVNYEMELSFSSKESDILNNGWLNRIRVSCIIDDKSDVLLDVSIDSKGEMSFETMNLSGNIYMDFKRTLEIAAYKDLLNQCRPSWFFEENFPSLEAIDEQDEKINSIAKIIKSNPLNEFLDFSDLPKHPAKFIHDIDKRGCAIDGIQYFNDCTFYVDFDIWKQFTKTDILLNLPILDEIRGMNASEFSLYINNFKKNFNENCMSSDELSLFGTRDATSAINAIMNKVVDAFSVSNFSSFGEYYKMLEDEALADVGQLSDKNISQNWRNLKIRTGLGKNGFVDTINDLVNTLTMNSVDTYYTDTSIYPDFVLKRDVDFYFVYRALTYLERNRDITDKITHWDENGFEHYSYKSDNSFKWEDDLRYEFTYPISEVFRLYREFISDILSKFIKGQNFLGITSVGSFLCPVSRSYSIYDKSNPISSVLITYFDAQTRLNQEHFQRFQPGSFINKWIKSLGIGNAADIAMTEDKTAFKISIETNEQLVSSADYGHGVTQLLYILINIETAIVNNLLLRDKRTITLCFEEPEVSLHPSWQSKLAIIFKDAYDSYGIQFILETHSEYLIRATQAMVAQNCRTHEELNSFPYIVYYMERSGNAYDLQYQISGRFNRSFGPGFFDEASRSSVQILKRERELNNGKDV